ncbi:hypothetical protein [Streptomyces sp. NPDC058268]|uniref:hypothetical protein n=1 Tax=Streptomyces sp. NPDC058268 TaxID=3346413 RepID=UPI0036E48D0A
MTTHVLRFDGAHIRARVVGGQVLWFIRDVAAAAGVRLPPGPLSQPSPNGLLGLGSTSQVETVLHAAGYAELDAFKAWMAQSGKQLTAPTGSLQLVAQGPRRRGVPEAKSRDTSGSSRRPKSAPPPTLTA